MNIEPRIGHTAPDQGAPTSPPREAASAPPAATRATTRHANAIGRWHRPMSPRPAATSPAPSRMPNTVRMPANDSSTKNRSRYTIGIARLMA